jgi:hypothetical protein
VFDVRELGYIRPLLLHFVRDKFGKSLIQAKQFRVYFRQMSRETDTGGQRYPLVVPEKLR